MKRLPSLKQIQASKKNGARSKGPATGQGKEKIRFNALDHGLAAKTAVLPGESEQRFQTLFHRLMVEHDPQGPTQELLLEQCALAAWRLRRTVGFEKAILSHEIQQSAPHASGHTRAALAWADSKRLRLTARYEAAQLRAFRANLRDLYLAQQLCGESDEAVEVNETTWNEEDAPESATLPNKPEPAPHPQPEGSENA